MATHSSVLTWRIPGTAESGGLPSMGSQSQTRLKRLSSSSRSSMHCLVHPLGKKFPKAGTTWVFSVVESPEPGSQKSLSNVRD